MRYSVDVATTLCGRNCVLGGNGSARAGGRQRRAGDTDDAGGTREEGSRDRRPPPTITRTSPGFTLPETGTNFTTTQTCCEHASPQSARVWPHATTSSCFGQARYRQQPNLPRCGRSLGLRRRSRACKILPGLTADSRAQLWEVVITDKPAIVVASYYVIKPVADPLFTQIAEVTQRFTDSLFSALDRVAGSSEPPVRAIATRPRRQDSSVACSRSAREATRGQGEHRRCCPADDSRNSATRSPHRSHSWRLR